MPESGGGERADISIEYRALHEQDRVRLPVLGCSKAGIKVLRTIDLESKPSCVPGV
jgi:hypothetical protein